MGGSLSLTEVLKLAVYYAVFNLILFPASISLHEWGHWLSAYCLGYHNGYVTYTPAGGFFHPNQPLRSIYDGMIIGVSGGLTVALIFTALYLFLDWETDEAEKYALRNYIIHQTIYAFFEMLYGAGIINADLLIIVSGVIYPICLYGSLAILFIIHTRKFM
jgi:hypothetical protein